MVAAQHAPQQLTLTLVPRVDSTAVIIPFTPARDPDGEDLRYLLIRLQRLDYSHTLQDRRWRVEYVPPGVHCGKYVVYDRGLRRKTVTIQRPPRNIAKKFRRRDNATKKALRSAQMRLALYLMSHVIDWRWLKMVKNSSRFVRVEVASRKQVYKPKVIA